jgi:hypothetical protein
MPRILVHPLETAVSKFLDLRGQLPIELPKLASRDDSKLSGLAFSVRATSGFAELGELSGSHVGFNLRIPRLRVLLHGPIAELRELFAWQFRDLTLNFLEFAHRIASGREVYLSAETSSANAAVERRRADLSSAQQAHNEMARLLRARDDV